MEPRLEKSQTGFSFTEKSERSAKIPSLSLPHPKTPKADLFRVWTELCMRENQARIRNQQLLRDFAGLEDKLAVLAAKTDALRKRRKTDYEELLQRLRRDPPKHQGASRKQGLVMDKPLELLASPLSAEWNGQLPFEREYQRGQLPFAPFDIAPAHFPGAHGRFGPGFGEYEQGKAIIDHPFHSPTAYPARKQGSPASTSLGSLQRLQKDNKAWLFPGQKTSFSLSSQPWSVPGRITVLGGGLPLPEEQLRSVMVQVPEDQTIGSPKASNIRQGKEARRHSVPSSEGSAEENHDMALKKEGHHLARDPAGLSYHLRLHREAPSCVDESQLGLPLMRSDNDSSGASVSSLAEVNSGHWKAERPTKGLPRQQRIKAKHQGADTMILNEKFAHMSRERFPGQLEQEEMAKIQGSREILRQETLPCQEEQGDGELEEEVKSKKEGSVDEGGEATEAPDLELEQTAEESRPLREAGPQEGEEIRGSSGELEQGQEDHDGSNVGEVGKAGEVNSLGCFDQGQEDLEGDSEGGKGQATLGPGSQEGESAEGERNLQQSNGKGEKSNQEVERQSGEKSSKSDRSEESQDGASGDKEGGLEWAARNQEGPSHPEEKEEAASASSSSDEVIMGPQMCVTSQQDNHGVCQTPSLQSEGPLATRAESLGEDEEEEEEEDEDEEEEESEANTDIEAALAPSSNKSDTARDQQGEARIPNFQELKADSEEANKDGDLHEKDDFYD